jgi:hypothetical protein
VGVSDVFLMRKQLKIFQTVVGAIQVLVVNLKASRNWAVKGFPHRSMNSDASVLAIFARRNSMVKIRSNNGFEKTIRRVSSPCFAMLDAKRRGNAGSQELGHGFKFSAVGKHLLGFINPFCRKLFASGNTADVSVIANFVQIFVYQNRLPSFHKQFLFSTPMEYKAMFVGEQA